MLQRVSTKCLGLWLCLPLPSLPTVAVLQLHSGQQGAAGVQMASHAMSLHPLARQLLKQIALTCSRLALGRGRAGQCSVEEKCRKATAAAASR